MVNKIFYLFILVTMVTLASGAKLVLLWSDEFNGKQVDTNKWNYNEGCDGFGNDELQCYVANRRENARVEKGRLVIQAKHENYKNREYTSAKLTSKASWTYGLYEFRAKLPKGKHLWPAIWMMPQESAYGTWPRSGELDIMEYRGQRPNQILGTAHFGPAWNQKGDVGTGERNYQIDFSKAYHTFGFNWDPDGITWILDGNVIHTESINKNFWPGLYNATRQPFDRNFYIILNLAVGGKFFGDEKLDPAEADRWERPVIEIDWVRVSKWM